MLNPILQVFYTNCFQVIIEKNAPEVTYAQSTLLPGRLPICIAESQIHLSCVLITKGARVRLEQETVYTFGKRAILVHGRKFHEASPAVLKPGRTCLL